MEKIQYSEHYGIGKIPMEQNRGPGKVYSQMIFKKDAKTIQLEKLKTMLRHLNIYMQKNKV
jgi:hypothetical protein